jgi:transcriptional regulator of arginine metabolism
MKAQRQTVILRLVRQQRVESQEHLRELLAAEGIEVTQATLSRDIRELRLAKVADAAGGSRYAAPAEGAAVRPPLHQLLPTLLLSLHGVGPLLVVKTPSGSASTLAESLDAEGWSEIVGTIAGDNTILIISASPRAQRALSTRLRELAGIA